MSVPPPGAAGTTMRSGLAGNAGVCAIAPELSGIAAQLISSASHLSCSDPANLILLQIISRSPAENGPHRLASESCRAERGDVDVGPAARDELGHELSHHRSGSDAEVRIAEGK